MDQQDIELNEIIIKNMLRIAYSAISINKIEKLFERIYNACEEAK